MGAPIPLRNPFGKIIFFRECLKIAQNATGTSPMHFSRNFEYKNIWSKFWIFENGNLENGNLFEAAQSLLLRPPLPPVDSSILSELANLAECLQRARASAAYRTGPSSSILSCWQRRATNRLTHQNASPEVIRGSMSSLTERTEPI